MRCNISRLFLAIGVSLAAVGPALAGTGELLSADASETVDANIERNGGALLGPFVTTSARCRKTADSAAWIIEAPRYGRAAVVKKRGEIAYGDEHRYAYCNDRPISGTMIRYRPARGFAGDDTFVFTLRFSDGEVRTKRVNVHVE
ncbi:hypothetical protein [Methylocystis iwaonis]|uniref:Secreted protein n=1 Tax=Methylocystis iwaonis TaxID=2885079 RepID=A0ABN6VG24_9HYPH|nr:hypothetical protein [Methylocystis iwaonis]BDV34613.1 hypothetical protein SS37A_21420 [Methylocystis iwaonis]